MERMNRLGETPGSGAVYNILYFSVVDSMFASLLVFRLLKFLRGVFKSTLEIKPNNKASHTR